MSSAVSNEPKVTTTRPAGTPSARAEALAARLEQGAAALEAFAATLTDAEWQMHVRPGGRKLGVMVHHVAWIYPLEMQLALTVAAGKPVTGLVWDNIHELAAQHMTENDAVTKPQAFALLRQNSAAAAATIRTLSDEDLDRAAPVSLNDDAPLTCQFLLEDHAVRHSYHHLARIREAVKR
ncbi:MAG TPA: DinB family protein [Vicinamibacterales bacterium]|nr:DinB family protein [Vicinamibacterales bacterium]